MSVVLFDDDGHSLIVVDPDDILPEKEAGMLAVSILALPMAATAITEALDEATNPGNGMRISASTIDALRHALDALEGLRGMR